MFKKMFKKCLKKSLLKKFENITNCQRGGPGRGGWRIAAINKVDGLRQKLGWNTLNPKPG
jgi:hypothetical protein